MIPREGDERRLEALRSALLDIFFCETIGPYHVDWAAERLVLLPRRQISSVLSLVRLIAHSISDLLAFCLIENADRALQIMTPEQLEPWVKGALAIYESEGLHAAKAYLSRPEESGLLYADTGRVASLEEAAGHLRLLAGGLTGRELDFKPSPVVCTDTAVVYAPRTVARFPHRRLNDLLYRVLILHKCAQIRYRSFQMPLDALRKMSPRGWPEGDMDERGRELTGIEVFLERIAGRREARDLFALVETIRLEAEIARDFPGLARDIAALKEALAREEACGNTRKASPLMSVAGWILDGCRGEPRLPEERLRQSLMDLRKPGASALDSASACLALLNACPDLGDAEAAASRLPYVGTVRPRAVGRELLKQRKACQRKFVEILAAMILERRGGREDLKEAQPAGEAVSHQSGLGDGDQGLAMIMSGGQGKDRPPAEADGIECLFLDGEEGGLPDELRALMEEIRSDLGGVPESYVSSAVGLASGGWAEVDIPMADSGGPVTGLLTYDEWDFRRGAYRLEWCSLKEIEAPLVQGDFVEQTLRRYRGQVLTLRRQFEMLRKEQRFLRRQTEGEDIDLDAVVEAFADMKACRRPSEHLFIRQSREARDIAVAFLVDMSASTEGWINRAIKETLVLLCEALHVLGDRYAIYGFSGMRRTGCQFFHIKDFKDRWDATVKGRISGVNARDYTRMGPAIRHASTLLEGQEARLKLLITLSDGRPEDYDEYKGPYAVEDTRRALMEARKIGIRPFCITIDREAREYLPHMYGEAGYILVEDVGLLHRRVPEIYRTLTT